MLWNVIFFLPFPPSNSTFCSNKQNHFLYAQFPFLNQMCCVFMGVSQTPLWHIWSFLLHCFHRNKIKKFMINNIYVFKSDTLKYGNPIKILLTFYTNQYRNKTKRTFNSAPRAVNAYFPLLPHIHAIMGKMETSENIITKHEFLEISQWCVIRQMSSFILYKYKVLSNVLYVPGKTVTITVWLFYLVSFLNI